MRDAEVFAGKVRRGSSAPWRNSVVERVPICGGHSTHE